jgi:hypothetical protein
VLHGFVPVVPLMLRRTVICRPCAVLSVRSAWWLGTWSNVGKRFQGVLLRARRLTLWPVGWLWLVGFCLGTSGLWHSIFVVRVLRVVRRLQALQQRQHQIGHSVSLQCHHSETLSTDFTLRGPQVCYVSRRPTLSPSRKLWRRNCLSTVADWIQS